MIQCSKTTATSMLKPHSSGPWVIYTLDYSHWQTRTNKLAPIPGVFVSCGYSGTISSPIWAVQLVWTKGSAIAEELRDTLRQLKYYGRFLTELLTRSSANPEEPCEHNVSWNRVKCCTNVRRIACENASATGEWPSMSFKVTAVATIW